MSNSLADDGLVPVAVFSAALEGQFIPWRVILPLVLAGMSVYWLLPRPRPRSALTGAAAGLLSLALVGIWLIRPGAAPIPQATLFYAFSAMAVLAAGLMVTQRKPSRCALCFAVVVINVCGLFLLQGAPFLMAATVIIYAGAIVVTFLFVLMLAQHAGFSDADDRSREPFLTSLAGFGVLGCTLLLLDYTFPDPRNLSVLLGRAEHAVERATTDEMLDALGDTREYLAALHQEAQRFQGAAEVKTFAAALEDLEEALNPPRPVPADLRPELRKLLTVGRKLVAENRSGPLPAMNVAELGKLVYSAYLLAVELAGVLLLVAAVGAIAITGRRERAPA